MSDVTELKIELKLLKSSSRVLHDTLSGLLKALDDAPSFTDPLGRDYVEKTSLFRLSVADAYTTLEDFPRP